ncbi:MAG: MFS transporter [Candidatus Daviesbacteria bacterium]|nr:MFS transporter [Candidatus Daviesbacteria bacterium]
MAKETTFTSVISNRGFRYLWINQVLIQLAYNTLNFSLLIWVFKLTDSNLAVAMLLLCVYLPVAIFGIFAGVFVDLADKRRIILIVDFLLAVSFVIFIFIKGSFPLILLNTFFINSLAQFFMPSESSSIPLLVSKKQLFIANSLFSLTLYASFMAGSSLAGPILTHLGINAAFLFGAGSLGFAFILSRNLPTIKTVNKINIKKSYSIDYLIKLLELTRKEVKSTINFIKGRFDITVSIAILAGVQGIIGVLAVLMPSYLERVLKIHATDASYFVMLPLGFGMVIGAILVGRLFSNKPRRFLVIPAIVASGAVFFLMGVIPSIATALQSTDLPSYITHPRYFLRAPSLSFFFALLAFLAGLSAVSIIIPTQTSLQEKSTDSNRGKIFSMLAVLMTGFSAVPVVLAGGFADLFGAAPILVVAGLITMVVGLIARNPSWFFEEGHLPDHWREFLGLGHWKDKV